MEKLLERLLSKPTDFTWEELIKVLGHLGYVESKKGKSGGSRRKFSDSGNNAIRLHKPHPGNILKPYLLKMVIDHLRQKGKIKDG